MTKKMIQRRYYLTRKLRKAIRIDTKAKQLNVTDDKLQALTETQSKHMRELQNKYNYQIQYEIE